jgi:thioredoxin-like negative regulator of GroEL
MTEPKKTRRQMLEEFVAKKPDDAFSRYGLAMECMNSGDAAAANTHFRALLERNADYVPAYLMFAQFLARESRADEAKQVLTTGITAAEKKRDDHARSEMETLLNDLS